MTIVSPTPSVATAVPPTPAAHALPPHQRLQLARDALAGQPISELARHHDVSRQFGSQQAAEAEQALTEAFDPSPRPMAPSGSPCR
jgi:transposase-like protein